MILTDQSSQLNLNSKSFKAIKHIVFHWQGRELLRYPYPLFITARMPLSEEWKTAEVMHSYRGKYFSIYFTGNNAYYHYPMYLKTRFPERELLQEEEKNVEEEPSLEELFLKPVKNYFLYFQMIRYGLSLFPWSRTMYKIYCEMFDQSQKIVQNMDLDRENLFEVVEDIKLDVSESIYEEDFQAAREFDKYVLERFGSTMFSLFGTIESYYKNRSYCYDLEEVKRAFLTHLGEHNPNGYCGLNENTFKLYSSRLQLVILFDIHRQYVFSFSVDESRYVSPEWLAKVNLWKQPFSFGDPTLPFLAVENFYVRRFYRKFNLFNKT